MTLHAYIARCPGVGFDDPSVPGWIDWREGFEDCAVRSMRRWAGGTVDVEGDRV